MRRLSLFTPHMHTHGTITHNTSSTHGHINPHNSTYTLKVQCYYVCVFIFITDHMTFHELDALCHSSYVVNKHLEGQQLLQ